ncbi:MAG: hypothetical protein ACPGJV_01990 [Bacteriovoracaceae bacterium]
MKRLSKLLVIGLFLCFEAYGETNVMPSGVSSGAGDIQPSERSMPTYMTGLIYEAQCFGQNNRGTVNPLSPNGKVNTTISVGGSNFVASFPGRFPMRGRRHDNVVYERIQPFFQVSCNDFCSLSAQHKKLCDTQCDSFDSCAALGISVPSFTKGSGDSLSNEIAENTNLIDFIEGSSFSFINQFSTAENKMTDKWNSHHKTELNNLYDDLFRKKGSLAARCNMAQYSDHFDQLAKNVCGGVNNDNERHQCRTVANCTFACGLQGRKIDSVNINPANSQGNDYLKKLVSGIFPKSKLCLEGTSYASYWNIYHRFGGNLRNQILTTINNCNYESKLNAKLAIFGDSNPVEQCTSMCLLAAKGISPDAANSSNIASARSGGVEKMAWTPDSTDPALAECELNGSKANVTACQRGVMKAKLSDSLDLSGNVSLRFDQTGTGLSPRSYIGYDGQMKSVKSRVSYSDSQYGDFVRITASFPGQDGYCGGYHSPLMLFFDYKHPQYSNRSDFLRRDKDGVKTYWPEANHHGYFLAQLDKENPERGVTHAKQLFGNNVLSYDGFDILEEHDGNKDGVINKNDEVFSRLVLWKDKNGDGYSSPDELMKLGEKNIFEISLNVDKSFRITIKDRAKHQGKSKFKYFSSDKSKDVKIGDVTDVFFADAF